LRQAQTCSRNLGPVLRQAQTYSGIKCNIFLMYFIKVWYI
jgi:hypothetical protein